MRWLNSQTGRWIEEPDSSTTRTVDPHSAEGRAWAEFCREAGDRQLAALLRSRAEPMQWYLDQLGDA